MYSKCTEENSEKKQRKKNPEEKQLCIYRVFTERLKQLLTFFYIIYDLK